MDKAYIHISGPDSIQVTSAVQALANLYMDSGYAQGIEIYIYNNSSTEHIIKFTHLPDFERFKYFVNYLNYPEVDNYKASVKGYWTISEKDGLPATHNGQRVMLYVPDYDEEGDNVYATFDGGATSYKFGFAMGEEYTELEKRHKPFAEENHNDTEYSLLTSVDYDPNSKPAVGRKGCMVSLSVFILVSIYLVFA